MPFSALLLKIKNPVNAWFTGFFVALTCVPCGERGIRTPGTVARTPHFECGPIDHSGISPFWSWSAAFALYYLASCPQHSVSCILALCPLHPVSCIQHSAPLHFTPKLSFWDCKYRHIFYFFAVPGKKNAPEPKFIPENAPEASFYSEKDYLCRDS